MRNGKLEKNARGDINQLIKKSEDKKSLSKAIDFLKSKKVSYVDIDVNKTLYCNSRPIKADVICYIKSSNHILENVWLLVDTKKYSQENESLLKMSRFYFSEINDLEMVLFTNYEKPIMFFKKYINGTYRICKTTKVPNFYE
ncbi:hypothetical protein [Malacoplasma iowae]|uniref:Uncharacterized protein n=1 Tax=Malacoplasma iowae 695 TaxID=1048830 RepID=A0A6P1LDV7_MALIO|nr:hypothetical protein [Malacoplasma iowae]VEU63373.1 Uncharacterised protein [Mycoplasmopsis fermentans]EGZ31559.1 hypothetical protein GUU_01527 [Malacoplasma iowae 695]QHG89649.1 hypothetical protein EER00_01910 [Malacoplasma iowae 695]WPL35565.1 hypothetical protein QX180_04535 [Malacoplasma iowae]WPL36909.1 hypothetical protein QX179_00280 [Malacoplasma iowae]